MPVTRKHGGNNGCWTCKLRRKKCDEIRPTCGDCAGLEIACAYGPKPAWMQSEAHQQRKMALLKDEIKRKAAHRRERVNTSSDKVVNIIPDIVVPNDLLSTEVMDHTQCVNRASVPMSMASSAYQAPPFPFSLLPKDGQQYHYSTSPIQQSPIEADFINKYLDFVFPVLFPFYRPSLFDTGRSWLLQLLNKSQIAHHAGLSMSCYFFTMALIDMEGTSGEHADCRLLRWDEVESHTQRCFDSLRTNMLALDLHSLGTEKMEKVEILESVVHVLIFELALGKAAPWTSHLPPAFALLRDIIAADEQEQTQSRLTSVLLGIEKPLWTNPADGTHIWSPTQAGFKFCAALLVFIDVIASTALGEPPHLLNYHHELLSEIDDGTSLPSDAEVRLSVIFGVRNWVVRCIAEIAALDAWKKEAVAANSLNGVELVNCASDIVDTLKMGMLEIRNEPAASDPRPRAPFDVTPDPSASGTSTLIWALAAQLYLTVVVYGWQFSNLEIRTNVAQIIELLKAVPPHQLHAFAWPICVAGSLALEAEEALFSSLFAETGKVDTAGALDDTRQIIEQVWQRRRAIDLTTWDLTSCLNILGSAILLV